MARLTHLTDGDVRGLAGVFELGDVTGWGEVPAGTINSNFWLEAGGQRWFLRVNEGKSEADVRWEADLVHELAQAGVPTPVPRPARGGARFAPLGPRRVSVFPWVAGHHLDAAQVSPAAAAQVGRALAGLHRAGAPLSDRFDRAGIYTTEHVAERARRLRDDPRAASDPALARALARAGGELAQVQAAAAERAAAPHGLIHGDLFRDNVLFEGDRLVALLDFEQASRGAWVYDLAVCLNAWCFDDGGDPARTDPVLEPERAQALLAGYQDVRSLAPAERALLHLELRAAAVRFTVTRITDVYLPGADLPGKDFRRYLARLEAWCALDVAELAGWLGPD